MWLRRCLLLLCWATGSALAFSGSAFTVDTIKTANLPREARQTLTLIFAGGPFPYERDGIVFGNFEKRLPPEKRGYYREYTVTTPGLSHRGARRIVCGGLPPTRPAACWYSGDHYRSFQRIED